MILSPKEKSSELTIWPKKLEEMKKISFLMELSNSSLIKLQSLMENSEPVPPTTPMMDNSTLHKEVIMMTELMLLKLMLMLIWLMPIEQLMQHHIDKIY